jgi:hypothetical protein
VNPGIAISANISNADEALSALKTPELELCLLKALVDADWVTVARTIRI